LWCQTAGKANNIHQRHPVLPQWFEVNPPNSDLTRWLHNPDQEFSFSSTLLSLHLEVIIWHDRILH
jgi:hypothetical protein